MSAITDSTICEKSQNRPLGKRGRIAIFIPGKGQVEGGSGIKRGEDKIDEKRQAVIGDHPQTYN